MKYLVLTLFITISINASVLDSYGFFSHKEKKDHRRLEGSHLDKKYEISNHRTKVKNKIKNILSSSHSNIKQKHHESKRKLHGKKITRKKIVHEHTKKKLRELKGNIHKKIRHKRR